MKIIRAWTHDYRPFIMGGDCNKPMACDVEAAGPYDLGRGIKGYLINSPTGKQFVVEAKSLGIVGPSLPEVKADIKRTSKKVCDKQIKDARVQGKGARVVQPSEFWTRLKAV